MGPRSCLQGVAWGGHWPWWVQDPVLPQPCGESGRLPGPAWLPLTQLPSCPLCEATTSPQACTRSRGTTSTSCSRTLARGPTASRAAAGPRSLTCCEVGVRRSRRSAVCPSGLRLQHSGVTGTWTRHWPSLLVAPGPCLVSGQLQSHQYRAFQNWYSWCPRPSGCVLCRVANGAGCRSHRVWRTVG